MAEELNIGDYVSFSVVGDDKRKRGYVVHHPTTGALTAIEEDSHVVLNEMPSDVKKLKTRKEPDEKAARMIAGLTERHERQKGEKQAGERSRPRRFDPEVRRAIGEVYRDLNATMYSQKWNEVGNKLAGLDREAPVEVLLGALRCTFLVRKKVAQWYQLRDVVRTIIASGDIGPVEEVMRGLLEDAPTE